MLNITHLFAHVNNGGDSLNGKVTAGLAESNDGL